MVGVLGKTRKKLNYDFLPFLDFCFSLETETCKGLFFYRDAEVADGH